MQAGHQNTESVLALLSQTLQAMGGQKNSADVLAECDQVRATLKDIMVNMEDICNILPFCDMYVHLSGHSEFRTD